jgi:hypothetical protein
MRVGRYSDMVDHEVRGVVEAEGKESGRCSNGGEVGLTTGSFCLAKDPSAETPHREAKEGNEKDPRYLRIWYFGENISVFVSQVILLFLNVVLQFDCWKE